jgi:drug/metabolite transporter (DMT)-like permease
VPGLRELRPQRGDLLVFAGAVAWAAHIAFLGRFAERHSAMLLSLIQMGAAAALHLVACAGVGLQPDRALDVWPLLLLTGVLGSGVAFSIQAVAQARVSPARAAIILAGESLVSALSAAIWLGERMDLQRWIGAVLILVAMLVSELGARRPPLERIDPAVP